MAVSFKPILTYNGTTITSVTFQGTNVKKVICNDVTVFCATCSAENSSCGSNCVANSSGSGGSPNPCSTICKAAGFGAVHY